MADNTDRRILGTSDEAEFPLETGLFSPQTPPFTELEQTLRADRNSSKPMHFRVDGWTGQDTTSGDGYFNHIDWLEPAYQPQKMESWFDPASHILKGLRITYTNGMVFFGGTTDISGPTTSTEQLDWDRQQQALFINIGSSPVDGSSTGQRSIDHLSMGFTSDKGGQYKSFTGDLPLASKVVCFKIPLSKRFWDFRGFYGAFNKDRISMLGPIWCNNKNPFEKPPIAPFTICPDMDRYSEEIRMKLRAYQTDDYRQYQLSKLAAQTFANRTDIPSANGFFCTLSDNHLRGTQRLTKLSFGFSSDGNWLMRLWLGNETTPDPIPGFGAGEFKEIPKPGETLKDEEIVGCTIFSATTDNSHVWIVGLELQIETQGAVFTKHRVSAFVCPSVRKIFDGEENKAWKLHSEVMHPPARRGNWVIRGFWGVSGAILDRLGVVWMNLDEEKS
jgi:hypothetical protein